MKICVISKSDKNGGGASKYAQFLVQKYNALGHQAEHINIQYLKQHLHPLIFKTKMFFKFKIEKKLFGLPDYFKVWFSELKKIVKDYDVIHLHDTSSFISFRTAIALSKIKPLMWTLHDCSIFTGGCLYPMDSIEYQKIGGQCTDKAWPINAAWVHTRFLQEQKRKADFSRIRFSSPSKWLIDTAAKSVVLKQYKISHITNAVDTDLYYPVKRKPKRKRIYILLSACNLDDYRKGADIAIKAVKQFSPNKIRILVLGKASDDFRTQLSGYNVSYFGFVDDEAKIRTVYKLADIFLFTSRADNQPLSILESLSCGTPVVATKVGGIPEVINDRVGSVYGLDDFAGMKNGIEQIKAEITLFSNNARAYILDQHKESYKKNLDELITLQNEHSS